MGVKIYPSRVRQKAESMNQKLETLKENIAVEKEAQSQLSYEFLQLSGLAWDSARSYVSEVQLPLLQMTDLWVEAEMEGNKNYQTAADDLPRVHCLDEDQLRRNIQEWRADIREEERDEYPNYARINRLQGYIDDANDKLEAMRTFVRITNGIYDRAREMHRILSKTETELKDVQYNPKTMILEFTPVDPARILELDWVHKMEQVKAAGFTKEEIKALCEQKIMAEVAIAAWEEMKERELNREDLKDMETLGYNFARILELWSSLETKEDKHFFTCLIQGQEFEIKYTEAFAIDPNELSYATTIIMSDYACRLLEKGIGIEGDNVPEKNFIAFNNALLNSGEIFDDVWPDGTRTESLKTYRDIYLERICAGTSMLLDVDTGRILTAKTENISGEEDKKLVAAHAWKHNMCGYWAMQKLFVSKRKGLHTNDNHFYIADITNYGGEVSGIDFNLGYYLDWSMSWETAEIDMSAATSSQLKASWDVEELRGIKKAKENLLGEMILKTAQSGVLLGISYTNPGAAICASIGTMILNESAGTVTGLDSLTTNQLGKAGIKSGNILAANGINYIFQLNKMNSKLDDKNYQIMMEWLGKGATYAIKEPYNTEDYSGVAFAGFYDPEKLFTLSRVETEGLAAMGGWESEDVKVIIGRIENIKDKNITEQMKEMSIGMIKGGYHAIKRDEDTYKVVISDMEVFLRAAAIIDQEVGNYKKNIMPNGVLETFFR